METMFNYTFIFFKEDVRDNVNVNSKLAISMYDRLQMLLKKNILLVLHV